MTNIFDFDRTPRVCRDRAGRMREIAAEAAEPKIRAILARLADDYDRMADQTDERPDGARLRRERSRD
jgi:hypothetical protein